MKYFSNNGFKQLDPVVLGSNSISTTNCINITLTADNDAGTAALSTIYLFAGAGDTSRATLPAGVTVSGDYTVWANFQNFVSRVPMAIKSIQLVTSDTANYSQRLSYGLMSPSRRNEISPYFDLTKYRQLAGSGYSDTLNIVIPEGQRPITLPQFFMAMILKKNTNTALTIEVDKVQLDAILKTFNF